MENTEINLLREKFENCKAEMEAKASDLSTAEQKVDYLIIIDEEGVCHRAFLKKINLAVWRLAQGVKEENGTFQMKEFLLNNLLLKEHSDASILANEFVYANAVEKVGDVISFFFTYLKKN